MQFKSNIASQCLFELPILMEYKMETLEEYITVWEKDIEKRPYIKCKDGVWIQSLLNDFDYKNKK